MRITLNEKEFKIDGEVSLKDLLIINENGRLLYTFSNDDIDFGADIGIKIMKPKFDKDLITNYKNSLENNIKISDEFIISKIEDNNLYFNDHKFFSLIKVIELLEDENKTLDKENSKVYLKYIGA